MKYVGFGLEEYIAKLEHLGTKSPHICGRAVYEGAKIVADSIRANINKLPVENSKKWSEDNKATGITAVQKAGLQEGFGVAKMRQDGGSFNVRAGFHDYNAQQTKKYPKGQPNAMIAAAVEGGTSFRKRHPFVAPAIRKSRGAAESKMKEVFETETRKIMEV